jgi:phosphate transport system permease protein
MEAENVTMLRTEADVKRMVRNQPGGHGNSARLKESIAKYIFMVLASMSIVLVVLICVFLFANGLPAIFKIGPREFLLGTTWKPGNNIYGILPMILGSVIVTIGAIIVGVPIGILTAVYLSRFCSRKLYKFIYPAVELLAGIPSVVYGFFGLVVIVPVVAALTKDFGGKGKSILTASILLGIMILPTIISMAKAALDAVPESYYEGSLALGATHERTVFHVMVPAAKSGIFAGVVLGVGRAIGETMAVIMVAGNQARMPKGILQGIRTMTANIVLEMGYATDLHREALIATGVVLFIFLLIINSIFSWMKRKSEAEH